MTKYIFIPLFLILSNVFVWTNIYSQELKTGTLEISVLDIGQGDAILVKTPNNYYGLIDTGRDFTVLSELSQALPFGRSYLDFVILTHSDADHIGGFDEILQSYKVKNLFFNKSSKTNELIESMKNDIIDTATKNYSIDMANDFTLDGVYFDIVWPEDNRETYTLDNSNDISAGILIKYNGYKFLTLGDLDSKFEEDSLTNVPAEDLDVDFLKVSHHGSKFSTSLEFLNKVKPEYSFISVGLNNSYGHPTSEVLGNLQNMNSDIYRTDLDGRITLTIKDQHANIKSNLSNREMEISK